ncbi:MAG: hypothetical protein QM535_20055 [Limnohabitans sp.]|nr:hypothetical protein [Limnohabitans sp.]
MKKTLKNSGKVLAIFALVVALLQISKPAKAKQPAWGCTYTGSYASGCIYGGYYIMRCQYGSTSCGYYVAALEQE